MYCPKCGSQNIENAQFCRACGTNLSSVSQALEGKLPEAVPTTLDHDLNRRRIEHAVKNILMGVVFQHFHSFTPAILIAAGITLICAVLFILLYRPKVDRDFVAGFLAR